MSGIVFAREMGSEKISWVKLLLEATNRTEFAFVSLFLQSQMFILITELSFRFDWTSSMLMSWGMEIAGMCKQRL